MKFYCIRIYRIAASKIPERKSSDTYFIIKALKLKSRFLLKHVKIICSPHVRWLVVYVHTWIVSFIAVAMNNRDQCKIIGLCKISHSIKQPCRSVCLKKAVEKIQYSKLLKFQASPKFCLTNCQTASQPACSKNLVPLGATLHNFRL